MKKLTIIMTLMLAFAMVLGACANTNNNEGALGTPGESGGLEESPVVGEGLDLTATVAPAESTEMEATDTPEMAATDTPEMAATDTPEVAATEAVTESAVLPATGSLNVARLSNFEDLPVYNANGEDLGSIEDLALNLNSGKVQFVLLDFGGFLGIGETTTPIPFAAFKLQNANGVTDAAGLTTNETVTGTETMTGNVEITGPYLLLNINENALDNAPDVNLDEIANQHDFDWNAQYGDFWKSMGLEHGAAVTATKAAGQKLMNSVLFEQLLEYDVVDMNDETVGSVEDVIADPETGDIRYLVMNIDPSIAAEDKLVPVPLSAVSLGSEDQTFKVNLDSQALTDAPSFNDTAWPTLDNIVNNNWDLDVDGFWADYEVH